MTNPAHRVEEARNSMTQEQSVRSHGKLRLTVVYRLKIKMANESDLDLFTDYLCTQ